LTLRQFVVFRSRIRLSEVISQTKRAEQD